MTRRSLAVAVGGCLLVLASAALAGAGGALATGGAGAAPPTGGPAQTDVEPDTVLLDVALEPDGDAVWTVSYRVLLDDENTTAAFRDIQADVERAPENYSAAFERRMTRTVRAAVNATGRAMALRNLSVTARNESLPQPTGVIVYRFEWTNFAVVDGETLRAGDAIDRLYLDASTQLSISWPADYGRSAVSPPPTRAEGDEVVWAGPLDFDRGEPRVAVAPGAGPTPTDGERAGGGLGGTDLLLVAVVAALVAGGLWVFARSAGLTVPVGRDEASSGSEEGDPRPADAGGDTGSGTGANASAGGGDGGDGAGEAVAATPPEELLSNEERVRKLVREAGGRMKQKQVAAELDWTAAKTSQVVGTMRDEGELEAFRLGRENVLRLPGEDPLGAAEEGDGEGGEDAPGDAESAAEDRSTDGADDGRGEDT